MKNRQNNNQPVLLTDKNLVTISKKYNDYITKNYITFEMGNSSHRSSDISLMVENEMRKTATMVELSENMTHRLEKKNILSTILDTHRINDKIKKNMEALNLDYRLDVSCSIRANYIKEMIKNVIMIYELLLIHNDFGLSYGYEIQFKNESLRGRAYRELFEIDFFIDIYNQDRYRTYIPDVENLCFKPYEHKIVYPITYSIEDTHIVINKNTVVVNLFDMEELKGKTEEDRDKIIKRNNNKLLSKYHKIISMLYAPIKKDVIKISFYRLRHLFQKENISISCLGVNRKFKDIFNDILHSIFSVDILEHTARVKFNEITYMFTRFNTKNMSHQATDGEKITYPKANDKDTIKYHFYIEKVENDYSYITGSLTISSQDNLEAPSKFYSTIKRN